MLEEGARPLICYIPAKNLRMEVYSFVVVALVPILSSY